MRAFWISAGVMFVIAGSLEALFFLLSCLGVGMGGAVTFGVLPTDDEPWVGALILGVYSLTFFATLIGGALHLVAGAAIIAGRRPRMLTWAAVVGSLVPMVTVYCAFTSLVAGVLGLLALVTEDRPPA